MADFTASSVAREYCQKWLDTPDLTLAKKLYRERPELFLNLESARTVVRRIRGHHGKKNAAQVRDKSLHTIPDYNTNPFQLPESHAESYDPVPIQQSKVLILSDIHIPYHDLSALTAAIDYGVKNSANTILLNGDLVDMFWQSKYQKDPRKRSTKEEFEAAREFLKTLRNIFPEARIIFKEGNHDERWEKWLYVKAPELFDDSEFTMESRLKLGELRIEIVKDKLPIKIGKLTVLHGHELQGSGGVNPARATFLKTMASVLIGHCHRTSTHTEPIFMGDVTVTNSSGCLSGLYPDFARINKWNHGFTFVEHDIPSGEYRLHNLKIINGKVY